MQKDTLIILMILNKIMGYLKLGYLVLVVQVATWLLIWLKTANEMTMLKSLHSIQILLH